MSISIDMGGWPGVAACVGQGGIGYRLVDSINQDVPVFGHRSDHAVETIDVRHADFILLIVVDRGGGGNDELTGGELGRRIDDPMQLELDVGNPFPGVGVAIGFHSAHDVRMSKGEMDGIWSITTEELRQFHGGLTDPSEGNRWTNHRRAEWDVGSVQAFHHDRSTIEARRITEQEYQSLWSASHG